VCGVGAEGFASFPCQTDKGLEEQRQGATGWALQKRTEAPYMTQLAQVRK
jgi:hypothetical protein